MKTLTTSTGYTCHPEWLFLARDELNIKFKDNRPLSEIAEDFEGCREIAYDDGFNPLITYVGYTELCEIRRRDPGIEDNELRVLVSLVKPGTEDV